MFQLLMNSLILILIFLSGCTKKSDPINIYDSNEYQTITKKGLITGESIWQPHVSVVIDTGTMVLFLMKIRLLG